MKRTCVVLLVLLATGIAQGQQEKPNGFWWLNSSETFKVGFVSGYVEAINRAYQSTKWRCLGESLESKTKWTEKEAAECVSPVAAYDFTNIRFGQLVDGVDEFYKDFRNKNIHINAALDYVRDQLRGDKSAKQLEEELNQYRRNAAK